LISGRKEYVALCVALLGRLPATLLARPGGASSPSKPPTSKKLMRRGVKTEISLGLGGSFEEMAVILRSSSSLSPSPPSRPGNAQLFCGVSTSLFGLTSGSAAGAGLASFLSISLNAGPRRIPKSPTKSESLPQLSTALGRVLTTEGRSSDELPEVEPNLKRCFLTPRSRTKEPRTRALATAAAARISREARRERNCWFEEREMVAVIRYIVIATRMSESAKRRMRDILLFGV